MPHFEATEEFVPQLSTAYYNVGVLQQQQGHLDAAKREYYVALKYGADATEIAQASEQSGISLAGNERTEDGWG